MMLYFYLKINAHRMKLRDNGKRKLKAKIKYLKYEIGSRRMTSKDAKKYLAGHMGYVKNASKYNLGKHESVECVLVENRIYVLYAFYLEVLDEFMYNKCNCDK